MTEEKGGRGSWVEMGEVERRPRFQVNRVDGALGDEEEMDRLYEDPDDDDHIGSYAKSFRHFTREALPRMDNYRNIMSIQAAHRPTLEELHNETLHGKVKPVCLTYEH
jgi:solute carrier family 12 sodium/potassium/chloride transporter 2